jgi:hypothetical protein
MLRRLNSRLLLGLALAVSVTPVAHVSAQTTEGAASAVQGRGNGVCLARALDGQESAARDGKGKLFYILAHPRSLLGLKAKGFAEMDCAAASLATEKQREEYKERVCELAASGNDAVQKQLETVFGETPAVLCANAEKIVGAWKRDKRAAR